MSKETKSISELVNAVSEEMTRLDYKPTVLKQYHIVWNKLCKHAGVRPANDFDMEFGMKFLDEAMRAQVGVGALLLGLNLAVSTLLSPGAICIQLDAAVYS